MTLSAPSSNATIASGTGTVTIKADCAVTNPSITAPVQDVVAGAADGYVDLPVTLSARDQPGHGQLRHGQREPRVQHVLRGSTSIKNTTPTR